ncbi:hypothetical protein DE146DRAFT_751174 [Phaeosphaeria sp. MPI-PUGE-AT-0046c]|nr:hypothetical protein DE146DRAFT_751174 [Phaeosphaeria sp. MPI-PUGE-AT-0046c]
MSHSIGYTQRRKSKGKREIPEAPHTPPRSPEPVEDESKMSGNVKDTATNALNNPTGGRDAGDVGSTLAKAAPTTGGVAPKTSEDKDTNAGFGLDNFEKDVKGSLKVHIKLDLDVDIRIQARIKGDIAIGLL